MKKTGSVTACFWWLQKTETLANLCEMLPVKQLSLFFSLLKHFCVFLLFHFLLFVCSCCLQCFPIILPLKQSQTGTSLNWFHLHHSYSCWSPFVSRFAPLFFRCTSWLRSSSKTGSQFALKVRTALACLCEMWCKRGSWWILMILRASRIWNCACFNSTSRCVCRFFLRFKTTTSVKVIVINDVIEIWRIMWEHS